MQENNSVTNVSSTATLEKPTRYRWVLPFLLLVIGTVSYCDRLNVAVLIADPSFLKEMGIQGDSLKAGLLMSIFTIGYGVSSFLFSSLGDIFGPRKIMGLAILLWSMSMFVGPLAGSFVVLAFTRVILGVGEGIHWPMQSKYISNWFPSSEHGRANGIWLLGPKLGPAIAVPLFAFILTHWGWHMTFYALGAASLVMFFVLRVLAPDTPSQSRWVNKAELDYITQEQKLIQQGPAVEKMTFKKGLRIVAGNAEFWILTAYYSCQCAIFWGLLTWLPSYLKVARGFSWSAMGNFTSLTWIGAAAMVVLVGALSDKLGRRSPFQIIAMLGYGGGIFLSSQLTDNVAAAWAIAIATMLGAGGMPVTWSLVNKIIPQEAIGTGSGVLNGISVGVGALMPTLIGFLINLTGGYTGGLMSMVGFAVGGLICAGIMTMKKY